MQAKPVPVNNALKLDADRALKNYVSDPDWMFKTGLGGVLTAAYWLLTAMDMRNLLLLPVALAIAAVVCGYHLRVVRTRIKKPDNKRIAEWDDWMDLFMSGITWLAIQFGISVFAFAIISTTIVLSFYAFNAPDSNAFAILLSAIFAIALTLFWVHFLTTYLWVNFAVEERVGGGVALRKISTRIRQNPTEFLTAWALCCGLQFAAILLPSLTIVGIFIVPTTLFAAQLLSTQILAQAWQSVDD